ncbi:DUF1707 SHOCT-like domain-containing protein [Solihabitans fulvus]|uniref:DUF1707 SHOCT-like domain-containing protein n=1 Tax=Solihabitans fulvus TaxID=1892852 RepID=UPI001661B87F|nr:DUF1707 domain-containing protein [Solihabitans fulvus]
MAEGEAGKLLVRLSDQDREQAVEVLNLAVSDGRLSWDEHAERVRLVYLARTSAELRPHLADLGGVTEVVPAQRVRALGSKIKRAPGPVRRVEARATFGAVVLDLCGLGPGEQLDVEASSFCGKVCMIVGDDARVIDDGTAVLGKRALPGPPDEPGGPVIRIVGRSTLGNLKVFRKSSWRAVWV